MKNHEKSENDLKMDMEGFTLSLALFDALPVLLFCASSILVSVMFQNILFIVGYCLSIAAGSGKVLWKIFLVLIKKTSFVFNEK